MFNMRRYVLLPLMTIVALAINNTTLAGPTYTDEITKAYEFSSRGGKDLYFFKKIWDTDISARKWWSLVDGFFYEYDTGSTEGAVFHATFELEGYTMEAEMEYDTHAGTHGWTGGVGKFSIYNAAGELLESEDWVGKSDKSGREVVRYTKHGTERLSGWMSDDLVGASTHLGDYHVLINIMDPSTITVHEPSILVFLGLGLMGLSLRKRKQL